MRYLVAYDIADPKRLRRVARRLEKSAVRLQKSVFLFEGGERLLRRLLREIERLIKVKEDVVQAWLLSDSPQPCEFICGTPLNSHPSVAVFSGKCQFFLSKERPEKP